MPEGWVGPYRVVEPLGVGGMGEVFLAHDTRLGRHVALKRLTAPVGDDTRPRLLREARAAATLNHPNIAAVYDVIEERDSAWIVMEFVAGETLSQRVRRGPLPVADALDIGVQLCDALAEAHANGIVHRDLKPANIRVTPEGKVKVLDFGVARIMAPEPSITTTADERDHTTVGKIAGTPGYMAPEQLAGRPGDERSDIYALGVVLYELLAGRKPFEQDDLLSLAIAVGRDAPVSLTRVRPGISRDVAAAVERALARRPQDRYESAAYLRAELRRLAALQADTTTTESNITPAVVVAVDGPQPRRRWAVAAALASLLVFAVVAGLFWRRPVEPPAPTRPIVAVLPLLNFTNDSTNEYLAAGFSDVLVSSLSRVPEIGVLSRTVTQEYADRHRDLKKIARALGASHVVDAGIQRQDDRLRVTVSLMRPQASLVVIWSESYDGTLDTVFDVQRQVAAGVTNALRLPTTAIRQAGPRPFSAAAFSEFSQGVAYLARPDVAGNLDKAIAHFEAALRIDDQFALAHARLGRAYVARFLDTRDPTDAQRAAAAAERAATLDVGDPQISIDLADVYSRVGRRPEAVARLQEVLRLQPENDEAHLALGRIYADAGETAKAVAQYEQAIAIRPRFWRHYNSLGSLYYRYGQYSDAARAFQRVTELQPDNHYGFLNLGAAYHAAGDSNRALLNYERSLKIEKSSIAYSNIGTIRYAQRKYDLAVAAYQDAIALTPKMPFLHSNLGDAYLRLDNRAAATASYERSVALSKELLRVNASDAREMAGLARAEAKLGRRADAAVHADEALRLNPTSGEVMYARAAVHAISGEREKAVAALQKALELGYSSTFVAEDDDFAAIRTLPEFQRLIRNSR